MMEQEPVNEQFITKLGSLPVVSSAWTQACDLYQKTKDSNSLLRATCNLAEGGIQTVISTTKPLVDKYQPQIEKVNAYACEKLSVLEEQYPVLTKPTDEVLQQSKDMCATVFKPVTNTVSAVKDSCYGTIEVAKNKIEAMKDFGVTTVNRTLDMALSRYALEKVNDALTVSEDYVEKYLPPTEEELLEKDNAPAEVDEVNAVMRVTALSTKLRQRMYRRAMKDIKGLQMRSREKLENLTFTVDLIQYARSATDDVKDTLEEKYEVAQKKVVLLWEQIQDESEQGLETETLEGKTIAVARRITRQLKNGMATMSGYIPAKLQPSIVRSRIEEAQKYTEELYQSFIDAKHFDDLPNWILTQAQEKMTYIQETVSFLADSLVSGPINWLASKPSTNPELNPTAEMRPVHGQEPELVQNLEPEQ